MTVMANNSSQAHSSPQGHSSFVVLMALCKKVLCLDIKKQNVLDLCNHYKQPRKIQDEILLSQQVSEETKIVLSVVWCTVLVVSLFGNSLVVLTFILNKNMRSVTNVFILSLAISDIMVTCTCVPIDIGNLISGDWIFGQFGCKLLPCITQFSVACSSLTLCCIAFDRYYAIVHPLKLKFVQTTQRATILQSIVCLISAASSIPYGFFYETEALDPCKEFGKPSTIVCLAQNLPETRRIFDIWVTFFVLFLGPFIFMSIAYAIICYKLWFQTPIGVRVHRQNDGRLRMKRRAIKMLITVVCIFVVCWSPLLLFNSIAEMSHVKTSISSITWRYVLQCISLSSTCMNPIVYAFMNEKFRKAFRTALRCNKAQVHPLVVRNNSLQMSTGSKKTTSQLENNDTTDRMANRTSESKV